jgi:aldehyde dehydrogenase (NAD(P)+)
MTTTTQAFPSRSTDSPIPPTSLQELDAVVARLADGARRLSRLDLDVRISLARSMQAGLLRVAEESVRAACRAKGIPLGTPQEGEEWGMGPWMVVRHLRLLQQALLALKRTQNTPVGHIGEIADGRLAVEVFPASSIDGMLFGNVRVDVHLQPGVSRQDLDRNRAPFYKARGHEGKVCLVLGGGNVNAIPAMDVITKLFNEAAGCVLKMNPVNAYLGPFLEHAFEEPIRQGYLAVVYGGADEGAYLVQHPGIDEIHITGSDETYDRIVWGPPGAERERRKAEGTPVTTKPVTAELGNVSPVIVVPGPYTDAELAYQAEDVASALTYNASFDCNAAKVVVLPQGWALRERFITALETALGRAPTRLAYYPGAEARYRRFLEGRTEVRRVGTEGEGRLPWALCTGLDAASDDIAFRQESFSPVMFETQVGSTDPGEFLDRAVTFANDRLWGTLNATLVVHPRTLKDPVLGPAVEGAIARLRYGTVGVNAWVGLLFAFATPPWGAYPGATPADIQSGTGWVHNTSMLEGIEKAVLRHPITIKPKPAYAITHRSAHRLLQRMTLLEEHGSWARVPAVLAAAIRA